MAAGTILAKECQRGDVMGGECVHVAEPFFLFLALGTAYEVSRREYRKNKARYLHNLAGQVRASDVVIEAYFLLENTTVGGEHGHQTLHDVDGCMFESSTLGMYACTERPGNRILVHAGDVRAYMEAIKVSSVRISTEEEGRSSSYTESSYRVHMDDIEELKELAELPPAHAKRDVVAPEYTSPEAERHALDTKRREKAGQEKRRQSQRREGGSGGVRLTSPARMLDLGVESLLAEVADWTLGAGSTQTSQLETVSVGRCEAVMQWQHHRKRGGRGGFMPRSLATRGYRPPTAYGCTADEC